MADTPKFEQLGTILYREEIATTQIGRVFRGYDRADGQPVEVKLGDPRCAELRADPAMLAKYAHPGVVRIRDAAIIDDDTPVLVQDLPEGTSIEEAQPRFDGLYRQIAHFIRETGAILDHAHSLGITHGDISPRTIRVADDDLPRITELGMGMITPASQRVSDSESNATGDPAALRERKFKLDERADVFALGAVMYFMLSGESVSDQPLALLSDPEAPLDDISPIDRVAPEAPTELRAICGQALATDPVHRYLHVRTMVRDLETYLQGKHRKPTVGIAMGVIGVMLVVVFGLWGTVGGGPARIVDVEVTALSGDASPSEAFALATADQALRINDRIRVRAVLSKPAYEFMALTLCPQMNSLFVTPHELTCFGMCNLKRCPCRRQRQLGRRQIQE